MAALGSERLGDGRSKSGLRLHSALIEKEAPAWEEPVRGSFGDPAALALSGVERMRRTVRGDGAPPPIHHLTGLKPVEAGFGTSTFSMPVIPWLLSTVPGLQCRGARGPESS